MDLSVIPWRIFFEALKDQQRSVVEMWVGRWRFRAAPSSLGATELLFEKVS